MFVSYFKFVYEEVSVKVLQHRYYQAHGKFQMKFCSDNESHNFKYKINHSFDFFLRQNKNKQNLFFQSKLISDK